MARGRVNFFNDTGGYGFIDTDDADDDVFFHMEDIGGPDLKEGQEVDFTIEQSPKGPRAKNVTRLDGPGAANLENVKGEVAFFNDTGGYGFIDADGVEEDVFFHMEDISGPDLAEGDKVTFDAEWSDSGYRTSNLVRGHESSTSVGSIPTNQESDAPTDTETEIYDAEGEDGSETEIYESRGNESVNYIHELDSNDGPLFCSQCETDLTSYTDPNYCPSCGSSISD